MLGGKIEEMETHCPSNDIIAEKTTETVDLCPKHSEASGTCHVRWKCYWGRDTFD